MRRGPRIAQLQCQNEIVDLSSVSRGGQSILSVSQGGLGSTQFSPQQLDNPSTIESQLFSEQWSLVVRERRIDVLSSVTRRLSRMLRGAWQYHKQGPKIDPTYLVAQVPGETNIRTALVHSSPSIKGANPLFNVGVEDEQSILEYGVQINRFVWRAGTPSVLPTKTTLTSKVSATMAQVANHLDNHGIDTVFCVDNSAGPAYSANLIASTAFPIFSVAASAPALNDSIMLGSDEPFFSVAIYVGTAAVLNYTVTPYLSVAGPAWTALAVGSGYTCWPVTPIATSLTRTGWLIVSFAPGAIVWSKETYNATNKYWLRLEISAFTSTTITPAVSTYAPQNTNRPYFTIPAAAMKGDAPPYALVRLHHPAGSTVNSELGTTSRIILASKSCNLAGFTPVLNAGNDGNPAAWAVTYGTDASAVADIVAAGGDHCAVSFVTNSSMLVRAIFTGTDVLPNYVGRYRLFARVQQVAGVAGELQMKYRALINSNAAGSTFVEGPVVKLQGVSQAFEVIDLTGPGGFLPIPFGKLDAADVLTGADLVLELHSERLTGAATLIIYDLWLMPCDEWICDLDDPLTDISYGSSALRGSTGLDVDNGVISDRTFKMLFDYAASISAPPVYPAETWNRRGALVKLEPGKDNNIYALAMNFPSVWGTGPFVGLPGKHLGFEVFLQPVYFYLRGDD